MARGGKKRKASALDAVKDAWFEPASNPIQRRRAVLAGEAARDTAEREAVLQLLDATVRAFTERFQALRDGTAAPAPAVTPPDADEVLADADEKVAGAAEAAPPEVAPEEPELLPPGATGLQAEVELLYEDVLWLFSLGDTDGALVSLERLLVVAPPSEHVRHFIQVNEKKLLKVYEAVLGPWSNVPRRTADDEIPSLFTTHAKLKALLELIDGKRSLEDLFGDSFLMPLETCALLHQLIRIRAVSLS